MKRREFIIFLGGAASLPPLLALAQQHGRLRRIGFLHVYTENRYLGVKL